MAETDARNTQWLWVFASTIGELNAIAPFLKRLLVETDGLPLALISDHEHYRGAYLERYPGACFETLDGSSQTARDLLARRPPRMLIIAEIPCLLSDAPCRFSFATLYRLKRAGVPVVLINGWLYHYQPASRLDAIERQLFARDYVGLIDLYLVQNDAVRNTVLSHGAESDRVRVTGNMKFDEVTVTPWSLDKAPSRELFRAILASERPCLVAGSVTNLDEQVELLDAFVTVLARCQDALLLLAPRHPEQADRMQQLEAFLRERGLAFRFKSHMSETPLDGINVVVLDTLGELRDAYAVATVAYVGINRNVLEPLAFGKRVVVSPGWDPMRANSHTCKLLLEHGTICEVPDAAALAAWCIAEFQHRGEGREHRVIVPELGHLQGASERCLEAIRPLLVT